MKIAHTFSSTLIETSLKPLLIQWRQYPSGEYDILYNNSINGTDIILIHWPRQNTQAIHTSMMELLLTLTSLKSNGANAIHIVMPYLPYNRQDKTTNPNSGLQLKHI